MPGYWEVSAALRMWSDRPRALWPRPAQATAGRAPQRRVAQLVVRPRDAGLVVRQRQHVEPRGRLAVGDASKKLSGGCVDPLRV